MQDVYEWVNSCLLSAEDSADDKTIEGQQQQQQQWQWCFELYTSPPRTVLMPYNATEGGSGKGSGGSFKGCGTVSDPSKGVVPTLSSMGFVPAAVIYLAWKGNSKATTTTVEVGGYFTPALLAAAVTEDIGAAIPTGNYTLLLWLVFSVCVYVYRTHLTSFLSCRRLLGSSLCYRQQVQQCETQ